jgi:crooked neck
LKENSRNYDVWWDYTRLEEDRGDAAKIREVYERAIGAVPPIADKR